MLSWLGSIVVWGLAAFAALMGATGIEEELKPIMVAPKPDGRTATTLSETIALLKRDNGKYRGHRDMAMLAVGLIAIGLFLGMFPWHSTFRKWVGLSLNLVAWAIVYQNRDKVQWAKFRLF